MFGFFLFAAIFVALCLITAEPAPATVLALAPAAKAQPEALMPDIDLPPLEELVAEAEALAARPVPSITAAAAMAAPVAILAISTAKTQPKRPTVAELRKDCTKAGIRWRDAKGKGKHLNQAEMIKALGL